MNAAAMTVLVASAGLALVVQNAIMLGAARDLGGILPALWLNSVVGVGVLTVALVQRGGLAPVAQHLSTGAWHLLLPGLLGTYFVACSLLGYRSLGAAPTVALLVASQLAAGLIYDNLLSPVSPDGTGSPVSLRQGLGAVMLVAGAALVRAPEAST